MVNVKRKVSKFIGGTQCVFGLLASVFAFIIYISPPMRETSAIASEEVYLYIFLSSIFGVFSILSGLLLLRGEK
jgi:hypothetical protein